MFYSGFWTTVAREIPFSFIQFPLYEGLKKHWAAAQGTPHVTPAQGAACGSFAGAVAGALTCPLDVVKTRMMLGAASASGDLWRNHGTLRSLTLIAREEGAFALFHGIGPRVGWITLGGCAEIQPRFSRDSAESTSPSESSSACPIFFIFIIFNPGTSSSARTRRQQSSAGDPARGASADARRRDVGARRTRPERRRHVPDQGQLLAGLVNVDESHSIPAVAGHV